jgi:2-amino-4-hydroxy-6-hydroxymethyldihydropteridine diphosphokinase
MEITNEVYLSLGSNLGDRQLYLEKAIELLTQNGFNVEVISPVYETPAIAIEGAPDFLNCCLKGNTFMNPVELLTRLQEIELLLGRVRRENTTLSRTIDIDLIFFGNSVINQPYLQIPHPRYHERKFVLLPLLDIDSNLIDPLLGIPVHHFFENCPDKSILKKIQ